ncbi:MAG TPA: amidohydrolase family protein [Opitutaceae bacterium]
MHAVLPGISALLPWLPEYWREQVTQTGFRGLVDHWHPPQLPFAGRRPAGAPADLVREVLDRPPAPAAAILHCDYAIESLHNPDASAAFATAANEWLFHHWLVADRRLRASIVVPSPFPELAAREIDRWANQPGWVQVLLPVRSPEPYGSKNYRPLFAAAARHGLPVALHYGGAPGNPPTPAGWSTLFMEEYAGMTGVFQTQVISLVAGGVFDEFPALKIVLVESGFTWLPAMLWRFDKNWKGLRREIPWVRRPPSDYIREHFRATIAPGDGPDDPEGLAAMIDDLGIDDLLLYASDYPHEHGDAAAAWWSGLGAKRRNRIGSENPRALYRL